MQKDWKNPTEKQISRFRSLTFFFITSALEEDICYDSVYKSLSKVKEDGFGGIIFFNKSMAYNNNGFTEEEYLGTRFMQLLKDCAKICSDLNLVMWIHDGYGCPPGTAGGRINRREYPELTPLRLRLNEKDIVTIEEVSWGFPAFEYSKSAELHQQYVYEAIDREVGEYFGNTIKGFFSDADNRKINDDVHEKESPMKDYFPWTTNFKQTFLDVFKYDITPFLPSIIKRENSIQAVDYWTHAGNLYQGWFKSNHKWCEEHGLLYTYHTSDASPLTIEQSQRSSIYTEGKAINVCKHGDFAGVDHMGLRLNGGSLTRTESHDFETVWGDIAPSNLYNPNFYSGAKLDLRIKQAQSSCFLNNLNGVFCEMFAADRWWVTPTQLLEISSWGIMQGVSFHCTHAYHMRLLDHLKYFAPPDFSHHSLLSHSNKYINDIIAKYIYFATLGTLQAPIAVLDISDDILLGLKDTMPYFDLCDNLRRLPYGFVIADEEAILKNKDKFSVVITAGYKPHGKGAEMLKMAGIPVINADETYKLNEFVKCDVKYEGYGKPLFMRRLLDDGTQLVAIANLYDGKRMNGKISIEGCTFDVDLETGEIGFFTRDGQVIIEKKPVFNEVLYNIDTPANVCFEKSNIIPLEYWQNKEGKTVAKNTNDSIISFTFSVVEEGTDNYKLFIPNSLSAKVKNVLLDGIVLNNSTSDNFFDDKGVSFSLNQLKVVGKHTISIEKEFGFRDFENMYLMGDFNVDIKIKNPMFTFVSTNGNTRNIPEKADVVLSKRSTTLDMNKSWALQGQPFYSGGVSYEFDVDLPKENNIVIDFGMVRDVVELSINGKSIGQRSRMPYAFDLSNVFGKVSIKAKVYNSNSNILDNFLIDSGFVSGVKICKCH